MRKKIYELYDLEGNKLREGTAIQLSEHLNCEESSIRDASNKPRFKKKYVIKRTNRREDPPKQKEPEREMTPVEVMYWALKTFGNTCTMFDPTPYLQDLRDTEGLDCRFREVIEPRSTNVTRQGRKKKPDVHYIVEVVCKQKKFEHSRMS